MRSAIIGVVALVLGALAALGYSHFLGEGKQVADLQTQVTKLQDDLAKAASDTKLAKSENDALTGQVQQLIASKDQLQKQVDDAKPPAMPGRPNLSGMFGGTDMKGIIKARADQKNDERLQMLVSRLHLTPDQVEKIKAAMEAESKRTEDMTAKMFSGEKVDFQSLVKNGQAFQSAEQVIQQVLTPDQKTAYQQMQTEEKNSSAESMASFQMNQVAPLLQLSESQKDQVETALYQAQINSEDPSWIAKNVNASNPSAILDVEEKAKEDALAPILTPTQLATYKQQAQAQLTLQRTMMQKFMPAGMGAATGASAPGAAPSAAPAPSPMNEAIPLRKM